MIRIILGVITGFIVWSIVWIGGEATLAMLSPGWLGVYSIEAQRSLTEGTPFKPDSAIASIYLIRSILTTLIAGYMAALVAGEYRRSTMILGIVLLVVGAIVEFMAWSIAPAWYHILFVLLLIPMTILGGRLRRSN
ncbi:MAG: hypothetical protein ABIV48_09670 [Pyrinomonadaceae bacterium]